MAGGFPLRKWAANDPRILQGTPSPTDLTSEQHSWETERHATLGLTWHPANDHFSFRTHSLILAETTKRSVLVETAKLFDPLGWLAPFVIRAKILIQSAWLLRLDWDTPLPPADAALWLAFFKDLPSLETIRDARWLGGDGAEESMEVHGFADASERGYAAVVYLRTSKSGSSSVQLIAAKSKVAPVKTVSLPRLELCATALLTTLVHHLRSVMSLEKAPTTLWTDSTVALHWIRGHASRWKTFVANRVARIQEQVPDAQWRHVPGRDNPADCASRGIMPFELLHNSLWWSGPAWLTHDTAKWPAQSASMAATELPETRVLTHLATANDKVEPELLLRFSSLTQLVRVTAWCLRWLSASQREARSAEGTPPPLQTREIDDGLLRWIRIVQRCHYSTDIAALSNNRPVATRSELSSLSPFLDDDGRLRVGGRLKHAWLSKDERHLIILPPSSWLSHLIILSCHRTNAPWRSAVHFGTPSLTLLASTRTSHSEAVDSQVHHLCTMESRHTSTRNGKPATEPGDSR